LKAATVTLESMYQQKCYVQEVGSFRTVV